MSTTIDITPNASKTIESLRHLTYTNESAIADIIDNSLDAHANNVWIALVESKNQDERAITILDDGTGMDFETLKEAVKLGSRTEKSSLDLGRFGMGLVTASISLARRLEVVTKFNGGELRKVVLDLDKIADTDKWGADEETPNLVEKAAFADISTGTLVKVSKIDRLKYARMSTVEDKLREELGQTFRKFIDAGKQIHINRKPISQIDPLELGGDSKTEVMFDEDVEFKGSTMSVKFVMLEQTGDSTAKERGYNITNQGIYIVRNERQIAKGVTMGIFTKHNDFNRVRIEVSYAQNLDDYFGLNFTKNEVTPDQALSDKLKQELNQFFTLARKRQKAIQAVSNKDKLDHTEAEDVISRKGKLLRTSNVMEKRAKRTSSGTERPTPTGTKNRENIRKFQSGNRTIIVKFGEVDLGETGDLYQYDFEGTMTVINWNISHPFHRDMVAKYSDEKNISLPLDFFLFSLVTAELSVTNDQTMHLIEQIKSTLSTNLRVLMK